MGNWLSTETTPPKRQKAVKAKPPFPFDRIPGPSLTEINKFLAPIDHHVFVSWKMYQTGEARIELTWSNSKKEMFHDQKTMQYKTILYHIAKRMYQYHGVAQDYTPLIFTLPDEDTEFLGDTVFYTDLPVSNMDSPASLLYKYWDAEAFADNEPPGQLPDAELPSVANPCSWNITRLGEGYSFDHSENITEENTRHYVLRTPDEATITVHGEDEATPGLHGPPDGWNLAELDFFYHTSWPAECILFKSSNTWNNIRQQVFYDILNESLEGPVDSLECLFPCKQYDMGFEATGGQPMYSIVEQGDLYPSYPLDWKEGIGFDRRNDKRLDHAFFSFDMRKKNSIIPMTDDTHLVGTSKTLGEVQPVDNVLFIWRIEIISKNKQRMPINHTTRDLKNDGFEIYEKNKLNLKF